MNAENAKRVVEEFLNCLHKGDVEGALARTTGNPEFLIFNNAIPNGVRTLCGMLPAIFKEGPEREYTGQYVDGNTVISQITIRGTSTLGKQYQNYYLIICHFTGDKISKVQEYLDSAYASTVFPPMQ